MRRMARCLLGRACAVVLAVLLGVSPVLSAASAFADGSSTAFDDAGGVSRPAVSSPTVVRELTDRRTANATHYLLSDGTVRAEIQQRPVRFRDGSGAWRRLDTALVPDATPGRVRAASTPLGVSFGSQDDSRGPVVLAGDGYSLSVDYLGGLEDTKIALGNRVTYPRVNSETDLAYEVRDDGIKETLVLGSSEAASVYRFRMDLDGLDVRRDFATGTWGLFREGSDSAELSIAPLVVFDSSSDGADEPAYCPDATMTVVPGRRCAYITYEVSRTWLTAPERVFPVYVDPTITLVSSDVNYLDTYTSSAYPDTKYATTSTELKCGRYDSSTGSNRTYVRFDLSSITPGVYVRDTEYKLRQFHQYYWTTPPTNTYVGVLTQSFSTGTTWNTQNAGVGHVADISDYLTYATTSQRDTDVKFDVDRTVQEWLSGTRANFGFINYQREDGSQDTTHWRKFRSEEYSNVSQRPTLYVYYSAPDAGSSSVDATSYAPGDVVTAVARFNTGATADVNAIKLTVRGMGPGNAGEVDRGSLLWTKTAPTEGRVSFPCSGPAGGYVSYDPNASGASEIELLPEQCTTDLHDATDGSQTYLAAHFAFRIAPTWGDVQQNDLVVTGSMDQTDGNDATSIWTSQAFRQETNFDVRPLALSAVPSWTTLASGWSTQTDCDGDGIPDDPGGSSACGRGAVRLDWPVAPGASAYRVYLFDGNTYRLVATTTETSWSSSGAGLYPPDVAIGALTPGYAGDPFLSGAGLDLRDDPTALYAKTAGTSVDGMPAYFFKVAPANSMRTTTLSDAPTATVTLDDRTIGLNDDGRHTDIDLSETVGGAATLLADTGDLALDVTDLSIASWGPVASLARHYDSGTGGAGSFAPGWRFSFERILTMGSTVATYTDADGETRRFVKRGGAWIAPSGFTGTLVQTTPGSCIIWPSGAGIAFDAAGRLSSEYDANGNAVNYDFGAGDGNDVRMTAANGGVIDVARTGAGIVTRATLASGEATRSIAYAAALDGGIASVTRYPGMIGSEIRIDYAYSGSLLSAISTPADARAAHDFGYTEGRLTSVTEPALASGTRPQAGVNYAGTPVTSVTLTRQGDVDGASASIEEHYELNPTGTLARASRPHEAGATTAWTSYSYSPQGYAAGSAEPDGEHLVTVLDAHGNTVRTSDERGATTFRSYDASDRPTVTVDERGATTRFSYDTRGNCVCEETALNAGENALTARIFDVFGRMVSETRAASATEAVVTECTYDLCGEVATSTIRAVRLSSDAVAGDISTRRAYDGLGTLIGEWDGLGAKVVSNTVDAAGRVTASEDASGVVAHSVVDALGRMIESWRSAEGTATRADWTRVEYDGAGRAWRETHLLWTPSGATTQSVVTRTFDAMGRETGSDDSVVGGLPALTAYDAAGSPVRQWAEGVDAYEKDRATLTDYDAAGRVVSVNEPGATASSHTTYLSGDLVCRETAADGTWTEYTYDAAGDRTSQAGSGEGGQTVSSCAYDLAGRLVSETDEAGVTTSHTYDLLGREIAAQGGEQGQPASAMDYNTRGDVLSQTDADGIRTEHRLDASGRSVCKSVLAAGESKTTTTTYDASGRVLATIDPDGLVVAYDYDTFGRLSRERRMPVTGLALKDETIVHDSLGRVVQTTDNRTGVTRRFVYPQDTPGRTTEVLSYGSVVTTTTIGADGIESARETGWGASGIARSVTGTDAAGRETVWAVGSLVFTRSFESTSGRLSRMSGPAFSLSLSYDDAGRKSASAATRASVTATDTYAYTADGRLASWVRSGTPARTFAYTAAGDLSAETVAGTSSVTMGYEAASHRLTWHKVGSSVDTTYTFDALGRRIAQGPIANKRATVFGYTGSGSLSSVDTSTGIHVTHTFDGAGTRVGSRVTTAGASVATTWTSEGTTLLSLASARSATPTSSVTETFSVDYLYDAAGAPYAGLYSSGTTKAPFLIVTNDHGDVVALTTTEGTPFATYDYDPWGSPTSTTSTTTPTLAAIASRQVLRYASYVWDEASGTYHTGARDYDPATRQFLTKDPANADGEESAYQYCGGDPAGKVDPTGEWAGKRHESMTFALARLLFAAVDVATWVARGAGIPDKFPLWALDINGRGWNYHFHNKGSLPGRIPIRAAVFKELPLDRRRTVAEAELRRARLLLLKGKAARREAALAVGRGVHAVEDIMAHGSLDQHVLPDFPVDDIHYVTPYEMLKGHPSGWRYLMARRSAYLYLGRAAKLSW